MKKIIIPAIIIILGGLSLTWYFANSNANDSVESEVLEPLPQVVTTIFPIYDVARDLVGDSAEVSLLLTPGVDSHSFEPSPSDIVAINNADLFIYAGEEMEPWVARLLDDLSTEVTVVDASSGITLIEGAHDDHHDDDHDDYDHHDDDHADDEDHDDDHEHGDLDPHFWLDFDNTQVMVTTIRVGLEGISALDSQLLIQNEASYISRLEDLDAQYQQTLSSCQSDTIVHGGHFTFGYMVEKYGLVYQSAQGINPDSEPTAQNIANLIELVRESNVQAVYSEEILDSRVANIIAEETDVPVLRLNGAHNITKEDFEQGVTFFDLMEENLDNLAIGLACN